nr:cation-transporting P-type ATPase [Actinomycetota bacterium]
MAVEPRTFSVSGMTCSSCVNSIEKSLKDIDGVSASVNFATETVHILAPTDVKNSEIIKNIKSAGYSATYVENGANPALHSRKSGVVLFFAILFAVPTIAVSMVHQWHEKVDAEILRILDSLNILPPLYSPT